MIDEKLERISSSLALVSGSDNSIHPISSFHSGIWKEGWLDRRGRLAFSFQREGWKGRGRGAGFFNLTSSA